jgi:hypothetical protein
VATAVDPQAIYNTTLADLGLQASNETAAIGEDEGYARTNTLNAENTLTGEEPTTYTAESNKANKGGLLESGINSQRKATIASNFASKRTANQAKLSQDLGGYKRQGELVGIKQVEGEHTAAEKRAIDEEAYNAANPGVTGQGR